MIVGINIIEIVNKVDFINSSGLFLTGKVLDKTFILCGEIKLLLSNNITIENTVY